MSISQDQHSTSLGSLVELFTLDASSLGGTTYRFTPQLEGTQDIVWKGNTFTPFPIVMDSSKTELGGALPKPTLTASNVDGILLSAILTMGDLVGASVLIERTFEKYLDNGSSPDTSAVLPGEYFIVEQKKLQNKEIISWSLTSILDVNFSKIPKRQALKSEFPGLSATRIRS